MMIEVPSAAIMADVFAREAEFFSIGTNDLIQYTLAIDRASRTLARLASPFDPSILRLIRGVVRAAEEHGIPVSLCGAMASDPLAAVLLVGLGLRDLSMEAAAIPEIKEALRRVTVAECESAAEAALALRQRRRGRGAVARQFAPRLYDLLTGTPRTLAAIAKPGPTSPVIGSRRSCGSARRKRAEPRDPVDRRHSAAMKTRERVIRLNHAARTLV